MAKASKVVAVERERGSAGLFQPAPRPCAHCQRLVQGQATSETLIYYCECGHDERIPRAPRR